jgi:hypothetical protein
MPWWPFARCSTRNRKQVMDVKQTSVSDDVTVRIQVQCLDGGVREESWPLETTGMFGSYWFPPRTFAR